MTPQELWEKLEKDQESYKKNILAMTPQEIMDKAWGIAIRNDIQYALKDEELDEDPELVEGLGALDDPLGCVCEYFDKMLAEHMDNIRRAIYDVAYASADAMWVCSDPDCAQYIRPLDVTPGNRSYKKWEAVQIFGADAIGYGVAHAIVEPGKFKPEELDKVVAAFGYENLDTMHATTTDRVVADQIVAECVFETYFGMQGILKYKNFDEAKKAVEGIIKGGEKNE